MTISILTYQIDAINRYIDKLEVISNTKGDLKDAYRDIVNELRKEHGKEPLVYKKKE